MIPFTKYFWMKGYTQIIGMVAIMVAAIRKESGVIVIPDLALDICAEVVAPVLYWFRISTRMDCMGFRFSLEVYR